LILLLVLPTVMVKVAFYAPAENKKMPKKKKPKAKSIKIKKEKGSY